MNLCFRLASSKCFPFQMVAAMGFRRLRALWALAALFPLCLAVMAQSAHYGGLTGTVSSGAHTPLGVVVDSHGNLFVVDTQMGVVQEVQAVNGVLPASPVPVTVASGFKTPYGIAVDASGDLFVADAGHGAIKEIVATGGVVSSSSSVQTVYSNASSWPVGVAVDSSGDVFFTDEDAPKAVYEIVADSSGKVSTSSYLQTLAPNSFSWAWGIFADAQGDLFVSDHNLNTVSEMVASGGAVSSGSALQTVVSNLAGPTGVALDANGNLFVEENDADDLIELAAGSWNQSATPSFRVVQGGFYDPTFLAAGLHGEIYVADTNHYLVKTIAVDPPDFGSVGVGSSSATIQVPFTFDSDTTLGGTAVVSNGANRATGMDFVGISGCQAGALYSAGESCLVAVQFSPQYPGLRLGAVELLDSSDNIFASVPLHGVGTAPQLVFLPAQPAPNVLPLNGGSAPWGVAVDANKNVYFADLNNSTIGMISGSTQQETLFPYTNYFSSPQGIALDGAGNLFVTDSSNDTVSEIQAGYNGQISAASKIVPISSGFSHPMGIAVDGLGDVFVADAYTNAIYEIVADSTGQVSSNSAILTIASGFGSLSGLAIDAIGNLYLADSANGAVDEIVAINGHVSSASQVITISTDFPSPIGVAVDAAGNVYVSDGSGTVSVLLTGGGNLSTSSTFLTLDRGLTYPTGVAVSANGDVYFTDQYTGLVQQLALSTPPSELDFPTPTVPGTVDTVEAASLTLVNIGNTVLNFPLALPGATSSFALSGDFLWSDATGCSPYGSFTLASGFPCVLIIDFKPTVTGPISGSLSFQTNSLNAASPNYAGVSIVLNGTGSAQPILSVPATLSIGNVLAGVTTSALLSVSNVGGAPLTIASIVRTAALSDFSVGAGGSCPIGSSFAANTSCTVEIDYAPAAGVAGAESAVFTITSDGGTKNFTVSATSLLSLTQPVIVLSSTTLDFGARIIGAEAWKWDQGVPLTQQTLTLTNEGAGTLQFSDLTTTTGVEDFYWQFENGQGSGSTCISSKHYGISELATGQSCTIQYAFLPWLNGARQGNLHIGSNSVSGDLNVTLKGVGVLPAGVLAVIPQQGASFRGGGKFATIDPNLHKVFAVSGGHLTEVDTNTLAYNSLSLGSQESPNQLALNAATGTIYGEGNGGFFTINEAAGIWNFTSELYEYFYDIAVNPATNKAYLTDYGSNIGIVDGAASNTYSAIKTKGATYLFSTSSLAVDSTNNLTYVLDNYEGKIAVISGSTLQTPFITGLPAQGSLLTFNPVSNKLYTNGSSKALTVIDGATHAVSSIAGIDTTAVTVNPVTNRVYATNFPPVWSSYAQTATIAVIDGSTQAVLANVPVGQASAGAEAIAIDTVSNEIYVSNGDDNGYSNSVSVIDGVTNTVSATVATDYDPGAVVVDEANHHAFVLNERLLPQGNPTGSIFVIASPKEDGPTLAPAIAASFATGAIGVNSTVSLNFTITNPNSSYTLSSVGFQALLPSGLQAAVGTTASCGGALTTGSDGTITLTGALIAPGGQCTVSLKVTGAAAGAYTIPSGAVTAWPSLTGNAASATLTVSNSPIVNGTVTAYGKPLAGVTITYHADTTTYQSGTTETDSNGNYSFAVTAGWSGQITPSLTGYTFTPSSNWIPTVTTGATQNFIAVITPPEVVTASTVGSASTTIVSGGTVADQGGAPVTARGVCFSTAANPTITGSCTSDGTGPGAFTSTLAGLQLNTSYHVRAYATSAAGTVYGSDVQFTTMNPSASGSVAGAYAYIAGGFSNTVTVIDTASQRVLGTVVLNPVGPTWYGDLCPFGVANSSTSGKVYVASQCINAISAINSSTLSVADYITVPITTGGSTVAAATSLDGSFVYVSDDEGPGPSAGNIHVINTSTEGISSFHIGKASYDLKLHPDGNRLYATNRDDSTVTVVDLATDTVTATINTGQYPFGMVINNAGTRAYTANYGDNTVSVIDVASGSQTLNTVLKTIPVGNYPLDVAVSNDGSRLYVSNYNDHTVSVFNTVGDANTPVGTISLSFAPDGLAVQPGSSYLWVLLPVASEAVIVNTAGDANTIVNTIAVSGRSGQLGSFFSTVAVSRHTPIINWTNPAAITYGTALGSTQLNAKASYGGSTVAGNFTYTPNAGTVLNAGTNLTLSVTFTPTDTTDYTTAKASVTLTVNPAAQTITFPAITATEYAGTALGLTASASSGLTISFISSTPTVCTVTGSTASLLTSGTCSLEAMQPGNAVYSAATPVYHSFWVSHAPQTITFPAITTQVVNASVTLAAKASSGLAVSYTSLTPAVCTVTGSTASLLTSGTCSIKAAQAGDTTYVAATSVSVSFKVSALTQTITFPAITASEYAVTALGLTASASSGLTVSFISSTPTVCTVSGSTATLLTSGTCSLEATQAGNAAYSAATPIYHSFWVSHAPQTIIFPAIATQVIETSITLKATASSGLALSYTSLTPAVCTVTGSTASLLTIGTCTIKAAQAGNTTYVAATSVSVSFTVSGAAQTITFPAVTASEYAVTTLGLTASASSGLTVSFISSTPTVCTVSGGTAALLTSGTCSLEAMQAGNSLYAAATPVYHSFWVSHATQTITFPAITGTLVALSNVNLTATASSGLAVSYTSLTPAVCTVTGGTASLLTSGTCTIKAAQAGNTVYVAATSVSFSFKVSGLTQTITFPAITASEYAVTTLGLTASASSGLTASFISLTPTVCTVNGSTASLLTSGTCTLEATQAGNAAYGAATPVYHSFWVSHAPQTITFPAITGTQVVKTTVNLAATASSGLTVSYTSLTPAVCTVSGNTASLLTSDACTIQASQAGNIVYSAATNVRQSFTVAAQ